MSNPEESKKEKEKQAQLAVPAYLLEQAHALGVDAAKAAAEGLAKAVEEARARKSTARDRNGADS